MFLYSYAVKFEPTEIMPEFRFSLTLHGVDITSRNIISETSHRGFEILLNVEAKTL